MKRQPKSAGKLVVLDSNDRISAETEEIQGRIRQRAYEISQMRGHSGREMEDWLSAESEIISVPPAELREKGKKFEVQLAVAGINPNDLEVMAAPDQILVKCDFHHDHETYDGTIHLCDFKSATLFRAIAFPEPIDVKSIRIQLEDGLLLITAFAVGGISDRPQRRRSEIPPTVEPKTRRRSPKPNAKAS